MQSSFPREPHSMTCSKSTSTPKKSSIAISTPGPLTPSRRLNRRCATTTPPPRKNKSSSLSACSSVSSKSPSRQIGRGHWGATTPNSDRFIPNRSAFQMDLCRSSVEHAEKNLSKTFEKLSNVNGGGRSQNSPSNTTTTAETDHQVESTTPLQEEFRRRMRGALLNIPLEDGNRHGNTNSSSNSGYNHLPTHYSGNETTTAQTSLSGLVENRENISSIVYASLPDNPEGNSVSGSSSQASSQRMLSFRSMSRDASFRSSNSSLNDGDAHSTVCTPTTPQRRFGHFTSNSSITCSPRRSAAVPLPSVDPFSHDQLHVLHRCASSNNSHGDSLSMAETRLRSVTKSIGRRIPKTPSRILDAPELVDDYYLNLVSWGENNVLAVALGQCVYLWEAETGNIRHLLTLRNDDDFVTSVAWATMRGNTNYIAVGTNHNAVQLWVLCQFSFVVYCSTFSCSCCQILKVGRRSRTKIAFTRWTQRPCWRTLLESALALFWRTWFSDYSTWCSQ